MCMRQGEVVEERTKQSWHVDLQLVRNYPVHCLQGKELDDCSYSRRLPGYTVLHVRLGVDGANFVEWFCNVFLPAVEDIRHTGPVVLFLDGHQSHTTLGLVEEAQDKGIVLYTFPPHTTHLLQPLDVGVFGPLKHVWSQILKEFKLETLAAKVDKHAFPSLVAKMWPRVLLPEHLIGGFRGAGLHPLS